MTGRDRVLHERAIATAEALSQLINAKRVDEKLRNLMMQDFFSKCSSLPSESYYMYLAELLESYAPDSVKELALNAKKDVVHRQKNADVGIVTIIPEELNACKIALSLDLDAPEDEYSNGLRFWETTLQNTKGEELQVVLTMVGEARTTQCAVACSRMFRLYNLGCSILCGVAAGVEGTVNLGDVIVADQVLDYEGQRLDPSGSKKRPLPYIPSVRLRRDVRYFHEHEGLWRNRLQEGLRILNRHGTELSKTPLHMLSKFDDGVILAGEKLIGDGTLPPMREQYHDKIRAADMEGSGFARACEEYGIPWLVFRGISDFGDKKGSSTRKLWKSTAAVASATAVAHFLSDAYRSTSEEVF